MKNFKFPQEETKTRGKVENLKSGTFYIDGDGDLCLKLLDYEVVSLFNSDGTYIPNFYTIDPDDQSDLTNVVLEVITDISDFEKKFSVEISER